MTISGKEDVDFSSTSLCLHEYVIEKYRNR
jgi:hypothetical protein